MKFTSTGLQVDSDIDIFNKLVNDAQIQLEPFLNGEELKVDSSSMIGRLFHIISKPISENQEIAQTILKQIDISQAEGIQLDNLAYCTARMKRNLASLASGELLVNGDSGAILPKGSSVANSLSGDIFLTQSDVSFDLNNVASITFKIENLVPKYFLRLSITGLISQNPVLSVEVDLSKVKTYLDCAYRIADSINTQSTLVKAQANNDATVTLTLVGNYHSDFSLSDNLSLVNSSKLVDIVSNSYNSIGAKANSITVKKTSIQGFNTATNPFYIPASKPVEKDSEFQRRLSYGKGRQTSSWDGIIASLYSVKGVSFVNVKNTNTITENGNVVPNGIAITVDGGDDAEIAQAVFNSVPCGIGMTGTVTKEVSDINVNNHTVSWSRPEKVDIAITLEITEYKDFPNNGKQLIKQYLVDYFNTISVGESVQYSRLYTPINFVNGFSISNLSIGKLGDSQGKENISMSHNQIARLSADNIMISGM